MSGPNVAGLTGVLGPGSNAHGPNEFILLDDVVPFMKSVASFFFRYGLYFTAQSNARGNP